MALRMSDMFEPDEIPSVHFENIDRKTDSKLSVNDVTKFAQAMPGPNSHECLEKIGNQIAIDSTDRLIDNWINRGDPLILKTPLKREKNMSIFKDIISINKIREKSARIVFNSGVDVTCNSLLAISKENNVYTKDNKDRHQMIGSLGVHGYNFITINCLYDFELDELVDTFNNYKKTPGQQANTKKAQDYFEIFKDIANIKLIDKKLEIAIHCGSMNDNSLLIIDDDNDVYYKKKLYYDNFIGIYEGCCTVSGCHNIRIEPYIGFDCDELIKQFKKHQDQIQTTTDFFDRSDSDILCSSLLNGLQVSETEIIPPIILNDMLRKGKLKLLEKDEMVLSRTNNTKFTKDGWACLEPVMSRAGNSSFSIGFRDVLKESLDLSRKQISNLVRKKIKNKWNPFTISGNPNDLPARSFYKKNKSIFEVGTAFGETSPSKEKYHHGGLLSDLQAKIHCNTSSLDNNLKKMFSFNYSNKFDSPINYATWDEFNCDNEMLDSIRKKTNNIWKNSKYNNKPNKEGETKMILYDVLVIDKKKKAILFEGKEFAEDFCGIMVILARIEKLKDCNFDSKNIEVVAVEIIEWDIKED